jgi:hypothetical protein
MSTIVAFDTDEGDFIKVEVDDPRGGPHRVSRDDQLTATGRRLEEVLNEARPTIRAVLSAMSGLAADEREVEFGIKLTAEAGVVVAKTALEANFVLRLKWTRPERPLAEEHRDDGHRDDG